VVAHHDFPTVVLLKSCCAKYCEATEAFELNNKTAIAVVEAVVGAHNNVKVCMPLARPRRPPPLEELV
jgi:hypothetical protein